MSVVADSWMSRGEERKRERDKERSYRSGADGRRVAQNSVFWVYVKRQELG